MSEKERLPLLLDEYAVCDVRSVNLYILVCFFPSDSLLLTILPAFA